MKAGPNMGNLARFCTSAWLDFMQYSINLEHGQIALTFHPTKFTSVLLAGSEKKCLMATLAAPGPHQRSACAAVLAY